MHDKLSKTEEQCTSLSTESEALRSQITGEHEFENFFYFNCYVIQSFYQMLVVVQYIEEYTPILQRVQSLFIIL